MRLLLDEGPLFPDPTENKRDIFEQACTCRRKYPYMQQQKHPMYTEHVSKTWPLAAE